MNSGDEAGDRGRQAGEPAPPAGALLGLQALVFALVAAAFTTYYLPQPVLPVLQQEFGVTPSQASWTVSALILGVTLANLPFGVLADRFPVRPLILAGGLVVALGSLLCALVHDLRLLVGLRLLQGLFLPALTTCLAAFLARSLPQERLNVVMGSYVSATVAGGLLGRLLGGWVHPPLHWRWAFVSAALLVLGAVLAATAWLPRSQARRPPAGPEQERLGFAALLGRPECLRVFLVALGAFFVFSSVFNYLPFYLAGPPFHASTQVITMMYLSYLLGIVVGPLAGRISNRLGSGAAMALGSVVFGLAIGLTLIPTYATVVMGLAGVCLGFFTVHAAAAGALNRRLAASLGRANSLYVLFYYAGGWLGITLGGWALARGGWPAVAGQDLIMLGLPLLVGLWEMRHRRKRKEKPL